MRGRTHVRESLYIRRRWKIFSFPLCSSYRVFALPVRMTSTYRNLTLVCFFLAIILTTVFSLECDRPAQFTNRAILDRYLRCLKSKIGPRYGKRMSPATGNFWPSWFSSGKSTEHFFNRPYEQSQFSEN